MKTQLLQLEQLNLRYMEPCCIILLTFSLTIPIWQSKADTNSTRASVVASWESISNRWGSVAFTQIRQAAEGGDASAQYFLAIAYAGGNGVAKDAVEEFKWTKLAAQQGMAGAQRRLGWKLQKGLGVTANVPEAIEWYHKAIEQGDAQARINMGHLNASPGNDEPDYQTANEWLRQGAEKGSARAQYLLGQVLSTQMDKSGHEAGNYPVAAEWYEKAAAQGHSKAMLELADLYYYGKLNRSYPDAVKWYVKAAGQGESEAVIKLGELYHDNHPGFPQNHAESARWYRIAAEKGDIGAQYQLGCLLLEGVNMPHDQVEAESWLHKAADQNYAEAAIKLGSLHKGSLESIAAKLSREDLEDAAQRQGGEEARLTLAIAYEEGQGGPVDLNQAAENYCTLLIFYVPGKIKEEALRRVIDLYAQKGATFQKTSNYAPKSPDEFAGFLNRVINNPAPPRIPVSSNSLFQVGEMFYRGEKLPADKKQAVNWFRRAAQAGSLEAINRVGELWAGGINGSPDPKEAVNWYHKAASKGLAAAQMNLGRAYEKGEGVEQNQIEAWAWLQLAKEQGVTEAGQELAQLGGKLSPDQLKEAKQRARELAH